MLFVPYTFKTAQRIKSDGEGPRNWEDFQCPDLPGGIAQQFISMHVYQYECSWTPSTNT